MTDLIKALRLIREECKSHTKCEECPLRNSDNKHCVINNGANPEDWRLVGDDNDDRVFM